MADLRSAVERMRGGGIFFNWRKIKERLMEKFQDLRSFSYDDEMQDSSLTTLVLSRGVKRILDTGDLIVAHCELMLQSSLKDGRESESESVSDGIKNLIEFANAYSQKQCDACQGDTEDPSLSD